MLLLWATGNIHGVIILIIRRIRMGGIHRVSQIPGMEGALTGIGSQGTRETENGEESIAKGL